MPNKSLNNALTLTIVIPVYNEENHLKACLDSIAKQSVRPYEVIVVDNNSTDATVEIAKKYDFVKVLSEKRQGQVFAQAKGFNKAKGTILGRIDADSILPVTWVRMVLRSFEATDIVAITGDPEPYDIFLKKLSVLIFHFYHSVICRVVSGYTMIWGANCALRKSAWEKIKDDMTYQRNIWEDYDMAFLLARFGRVQRIKQLKVGCSVRSVKKTLPEQVEYQYRAVRTFRSHVSFVRSEFFFLLKCTMFLVFPIAMLDELLLKLRKQI